MKCQYTDEQKKRFWSKVSIRGKNECWPWLKSIVGKGYGSVFLTVPGRCTQHKAHKVAYEIHHNIMLEPYVHSLHHCDNRLCCNPKHIYSGTNDDNIRDRQARNRQAKGEEHGRHILTENDVLGIRGCGHMISDAAFALMFDVSPTTIRYARTGKTWAYLI